MSLVIKLTLSLVFAKQAIAACTATTALPQNPTFIQNKTNNNEPDPWFAYIVGGPGQALPTFDTSGISFEAEFASSLPNPNEDYVALQQDLVVDCPGNYTFSFNYQGAAGPNDDCRIESGVVYKFGSSLITLYDIMFNTPAGKSTPGTIKSTPFALGPAHQFVFFNIRCPAASTFGINTPKFIKQ